MERKLRSHPLLARRSSELTHSEKREEFPLEIVSYRDDRGLSMKTGLSDV